MGAANITHNPFQTVRKTPLDRLFEALTDETKTVSGTEQLLDLIEGSLDQLETDDTIDAEATDKLVDALMDAMDCLLEGEAAWESLEDAITIYHHAKTQKDFYAVWQSKARELDGNEIRTQKYEHFLQACQMVERGEGEVLFGWLDKKISEFQKTRAGYLQLSVAEHEVTMESEMCHLMLLTGIDSWLEALTGLKLCIAEKRDVGRCRNAAELGQRALVTVQKFEQEARELESKYFVHYN